MLSPPGSKQLAIILLHCSLDANHMSALSMMMQSPSALTGFLSNVCIERLIFYALP